MSRSCLPVPKIVIGRPRIGADREVRHPAMVFAAELVRAVDAGQPERGRPQLVRVDVGLHVDLVAALRGMQRGDRALQQRLIFVDLDRVAEVARPALGERGVDAVWAERVDARANGDRNPGARAQPRAR